MFSTKALKKYFSENPLLSIVSVINLLGGMLFLFYFIHIDFMPTLHIQDMIHLIFSMAFLGLFMVMFLALLLVVPAFAWQSFESPIKEIIVKGKEKSKKSEEDTEETIRQLFGLNLLVGIFLMFWLMLFIKDTALVWCISLVTVIIAMIGQYAYILKDITISLKDKIPIFFSSISIYVIMMFPILALSITIKHANYLVINDDWIGWAVTIFGLMLVGITNMLTMYDESIRKWKYFVPLVAILFFAFLGAKDAGFISRDTMRILHMGNFTASKIVLKSDACKHLSQEYSSKVSLETNTTCVMRDVYVYSNIGQEILLRIKEDDNKSDEKVIIFKRDIISYAWKAKVKKTK